MNKKIVFFVLILFLFLGGFFLFSKADIFKNNRLLAAIKEFLPFEKSEKPPSQLVLLEQELREKYELLQKESVNQLDDISERVDSLDQKIVELETQIQTLGVLISEREIEEETGIEIEDQETEEEEEEKENETEEIEEQEQIICQKSAGSSTLRNNVIFNEIAWMGTNVSANNEWIELKNISGAPINLAGWQILDKDSNIKIIFNDSNNIPSNNFYLLERKEEAVPNIKADKIYTGSLSNENEILYLFDKNCQLQDEISASPDWSAGDNSSKRTIERKTDLSWQTSLNPGGTPKTENSSGYIVIPATSGGGGGAAASPPVVYPKILISEIQISPITERFVELYNPNSQAVNLTGWYIQRKTQSGVSWDSFVSSPKFEGKTISAKGYFLISKQIENSDIVLDLTLSDNNSLVLKNPNQEIVDKLGWGQAQDFETTPAENPTTGKSIGRKWNSETQEYQDTDNNLVDFETQGPTPKLQNQSPAPPQPQDTSPPTRTDGLPAGTLSAGTIETAISSTTDEIATCKYSINPDQDYDLMTDTFLTTNGTSHSALITGLTDGISYNYYVRCVDTSGNKNTDDLIITFSIISSPPDFSELDVVINEIAWMGTKANSSDEWIELYNNTSQEIDLTNWKIFEGGGETLIILLEKKISPFDYYLIERTDDTSISDIQADVSDTFGGSGLSNSGENLVLKDNLGNIIDTVNFSASWPAGKASPDYISMERINPKLSGSDSSNWASNNLVSRNGLDANGNPISGTPKAQNSVY